MECRGRIAEFMKWAACLTVMAAFITARSVPAHETTGRIIIDTDAALDDLRATALLLLDDHFEVVAIVTSDGSSSPAAGARNVRRAVEFLGHGDIPVGAGRELNLPAPPWRQMSEAMGWADIPGAAVDGAFEPAVETISRSLIKESIPVIYVCLGPMTNLAAVLEEGPETAKKIAAVYYYGTSPDRVGGSWNTARDPAAAAAVAASGIPVYFCALPDSSSLVFDGPFLEKISGMDSRAADFITRLHSDSRVVELLRRRHFISWDETAALCLIEPMIAEFQADPGKAAIFNLVSFDLQGAGGVYLQSVKYGGADPASTRETVVFREFPYEPELLREDIASIADEIIRRHGVEEWRAAVITNELHRHLGIYSILGVKMGIRARELLNASLDDLQVISFASGEPPLSCMNDGLQASTGASLGRGSISVDRSEKSAGAIFIKGESRLKMTVRDEVIAGIRDDIRRSITAHGDLTPAYFSEVRRLSLKYWLEMDRKDIFVEEVEEQGELK